MPIGTQPPEIQASAAPSVIPHRLGIKCGREIPIGARALYLWSGNKATLYRIHGTDRRAMDHWYKRVLRLRPPGQEDHLYKPARTGTKVVRMGLWSCSS